ncbi:MAG: hypothetical protein GWN58_62340 [Anaerolineae bacterium]|nr:hypothetical protein [Anaerolineae bacterium]
MPEPTDRTRFYERMWADVLTSEKAQAWRSGFKAGLFWGLGLAAGIVGVVYLFLREG